MNEVEKKGLLKPEIRDEILSIFSIIKQTLSTYLQVGYLDDAVEDATFQLYKAGYGKVEDYKKDIEDAKRQAVKEFSEKLKSSMISIDDCNKIADKSFKRNDDTNGWYFRGIRDGIKDCINLINEYDIDTKEK